MSASTDIVISLATLVAREGRREDARRELLKLIEPTRAEQGNLDYVLFEHTDSPGTFLMREAFVSMAALREHQATAHYLAFAAQADALLAAPLELTFLAQVSD
ncbi:putative quinol monooxygenase [Microbacterium sp. SA39]|uniref:putative quinol monooxygenase n=1 Tax=Microbacterium sp. SA39 TaxID=1263625 RepID=UPI0005FA3921|nr:putative quinol monooxygenase [Microbacterium sp. SA39]KJQ55921.1 putative monooxygenase YcnE [Microbacterium sp. SA39]